MNFKSLMMSGVLIVASAMAGSAATYSLGDATGGASTSKVLRVQTLDLLEFTLDAPSGFQFSTFDISVTSVPGSNLREMIALYSGSRLIASSDSRVGRGGGTATLSFSGASALADGSYTLAVGGWKSFFTPDIANARTTAFFRNGSYNVTLTPTLAAVPLPAGVLMLLTGLGALAVIRRKTSGSRA